MYSGFITAKRVVPALGVHQRFDASAYRLASPYFAPGTFPGLKTVLSFEGMNGPDGIKAKAPLDKGPSHLYDPESGSGELPGLIKQHYSGLITEIKRQDLVRAGFEAAWLAHYLCDGLTPAHHFPLEDRVAAFTTTGSKRKRYTQPVIVRGDTPSDAVKRSWALWGGKGLLTTHFNFEIGAAATLVGYRTRAKLDHHALAEARAMGVQEFFAREARSIASLGMYQEFYQYGWNAKLARAVRTRIAPQTIQIIAIAWVLAYLEAGQDMAKAAN